MEKNRIRPITTGKGFRMSYSRQKEVLEMPNLIEVQKDSYEWFLKEGLKEVFDDISPIADYSGHLSLEFVDFTLCEDDVKYTIDECKERDATYAAPLKVRVRLYNKENDEINEHEIFMGDLPLMTKTGTFVINGAERVIVSQLVRSPGIYYGIAHDKLGKKLYSATVIPNRGAWLEYETDSNDVFYVRIDKNRKIPITSFIRAIGVKTDAEIKELFGEDNVEFDVQNAQGEQTMCSTIINNFISSDVDLILANATLPLQTAAQATADIPILGTSVTDFATALGISDWTGATGVNISGTSDLAPIEEQEDMLIELLPDVKTVGILYCSAESNSKYQAELFAAELEKDGIEYKEYTAADSNEIQSVVTNAVSECDAIYIPTDNTMASNTQIINNICLPAGVPIIAGEQGICSGCGIATLSIDYYDIGYRAGEMAYEILAEGADITTMDVETASQVTKMYNPTICEELGITVPDDYEAIEAE